MYEPHCDAHDGAQGGQMTVQLDLVSEHRCFGGWQRYYQHDSQAIGLPMKFSVFLPEQSGATSAKIDGDDAFARRHVFGRLNLYRRHVYD